MTDKLQKYVCDKEFWKCLWKETCIVRMNDRTRNLNYVREGIISVVNKPLLSIYSWQNCSLFDVDVIESRVEGCGRGALCSESEIRGTVHEDIQRLKRAKHGNCSGIFILVLERDLVIDE